MCNFIWTGFRFRDHRSIIGCIMTLLNLYLRFYNRLKLLVQSKPRCTHLQQLFSNFLHYWASNVAELLKINPSHKFYLSNLCFSGHSVNQDILRTNSLQHNLVTFSLHGNYYKLSLNRAGQYGDVNI